MRSYNTRIIGRLKTCLHLYILGLLLSSLRVLAVVTISIEPLRKSLYPHSYPSSFHVGSKDPFHRRIRRQKVLRRIATSIAIWSRQRLINTPFRLLLKGSVDINPGILSPFISDLVQHDFVLYKQWPNQPRTVLS